MAIYSLHHSVIGKATQSRPHTVVAHLRYIQRPSACRQTYSARVPDSPAKLRGWLRNQEATDRKNARICDKLMLAIPRELNQVQRDALVQQYAETVTAGRASWVLAIHDKGKDARNPHCHLIIRDRDPATGKRVINTSERGSTERFRLAWETACNAALEQAQSQERVSRQSHQARGIRRQPTIHIGPRAQVLHARNRVPRSRTVTRINAPTARRRTRDIIYPPLDQGRSRAAYQAQIVLQNEQAYWQAIDEDNARRAAAAASPPGPGPGSFDKAAFVAARQARLVRPVGERPTKALGFDREAFVRRRNERQRSEGIDLDDD